MSDTGISTGGAEATPAGSAPGERLHGRMR